MFALNMKMHDVKIFPGLKYKFAKIMLVTIRCHDVVKAIGFWSKISFDLKDHLSSYTLV